jgi:hypothetical protein
MPIKYRVLDAPIKGQVAGDKVSLQPVPDICRKRWRYLLTLRRSSTIIQTPSTSV